MRLNWSALWGGAHQAEAADDFDSAKQWYTEAAALGDIDAMRALIYEYDEENLFQNWVWGVSLRTAGQRPPGKHVAGLP